jgi:hypothetical protein
MSGQSMKQGVYVYVMSRCTHLRGLLGFRSGHPLPQAQTSIPGSRLLAGAWARGGADWRGVDLDGGGGVRVGRDLGGSGAREVVGTQERGDAALCVGSDYLSSDFTLSSHTC